MFNHILLIWLVDLGVKLGKWRYILLDNVYCCRDTTTMLNTRILFVHSNNKNIYENDWRVHNGIHTTLIKFSEYSLWCSGMPSCVPTDRCWRFWISTKNSWEIVLSSPFSPIATSIYTLHNDIYMQEFKAIVQLLLNTKSLGLFLMFI